MRFRPGERVSVLLAHPPGHVRTPYYIRGKTGMIERICGDYPNPEELAYGRAGLPPVTLYRVRFLQVDVWMDYPHPSKDTVDIEIYEHWLNSAEGERYA